MKKVLNKLVVTGIILAGMLSSCGEDRSGEYYALIATKTWIYDVMQENYLFYQDIPSEDRLDFFDRPQEFLESAASNKDQKNGVLFSHVDSVFTESRATSTYPCFGFEAALVRTTGGTTTMRILYVQPDSPAKEAGLKRGDWVIAVDGEKISQSSYYEEYIERPSGTHIFTLGKYNPYVPNEDETESDDTYYEYTEFDTLGVVQLPAPRYVEEQDLLDAKLININSRKALYLLYNEFGENADKVEALFSQYAGQFDDVILDLRYNPGGYVSTSQKISTLLAPQSAMGQPFLNMAYNDKINKTETMLFDPSVLSTGTPAQYDNLYVITSENTASASEIVINCLRPYMGGHLFQVGTPTFGKNVAQQLFTDPSTPNIELWLTTTYLSNSEGYYEYYEDGLQPDFEIEENMGEELGEFGTEADSLMAPVFYRMANGSFPVTETPEEDEAENATLQSRTGKASAGCKVLGCSIGNKRKLNLLKR